jgi:hypothetical protein
VSQTKEYLDRFGKFIVQQSRTNLSKKKKKDTSALYNSISYELKVSKSSFQLSFKMEDYGIFVDKGVKGVSSSSKAPNSPFKFGSGSGRAGGLTRGIDGWVKRKRIQFKERGTGKFMSYDQTSYLIRNSIWNKGLETTNFFERPFELAFQKLPDELIEQYGLEFEDLLKFTLK